MFASRTNQENAVYQQQQATAAKNQGVNNLAPKTPGYKAPKTPFKIPLNDENATFGAGKTGGKGKDGLFGDGKGGKVDPSAFVTPAGMPTCPLCKLYSITHKVQAHATEHLWVTRLPMPKAMDFEHLQHGHCRSSHRPSLPVLGCVDRK